MLVRGDMLKFANRLMRQRTANIAQEIQLVRSGAKEYIQFRVKKYLNDLLNNLKTFEPVLTVKLI